MSPRTFFQVHGIDEGGRIVARRQLKRRQVVGFFANLSPCLVGLEACVTSHHWARQLVKLGHDVRLMPPRYVKPYVKRNKNDAADAEAICEAVQHPTMRFVRVKTPEQQSVLMLHRTRRAFVRQRTMLINTIRAHMAEFGIVAGIGRNGVEKLLQRIADRRVLAWHRRNRISKRLEAIPGLGPLVATALVASIPDPGMFRSGHDRSAWIGLVPRQNSTGGKDKLGGITKAGNRYLRRLLVVGALSVIKRANKPGYTRHPRLVRLMQRRTTMIAAIALANKMILSRGFVEIGSPHSPRATSNML